MNHLLRELFIVACCFFLASAGTASAAPSAPKAAWRIKVEEDKEGKPHSTIDLVVNDTQTVRIVVSDEVSNYGDHFEVLPRKEYANYRVPAAALCACFSWWEGSGARLYAIASRRGDVEVYQMVEDEEGRRVPWEHLRTIHVKKP